MKNTNTNSGNFTKEKFHRLLAAAFVAVIGLSMVLSMTACSTDAGGGNPINKEKEPEKPEEPGKEPEQEKEPETEKEPQGPGLLLTVSFENAKDAEISMEDFILNETDTVAVTVKETFAKYEWYINSVAAGGSLVSNGGKTITLGGGGDYLKVGNNRLSVKVTTDSGVIYSKTVIFTVEN